MPEYLAPGVYVEETSFRAKSIEGVSTSTTAFVGPARKGPVVGAANPPLQPELLTSFGDFARMYGGLNGLRFGTESEDRINYLAHAVLNYFNEGGGRLYVLRVAQDAKNAKIQLSGTSESAADRVLFRSRFPGSAGNATVSVREVLATATKKSLSTAKIGTLLRASGDSAAEPAVITGSQKAPFAVPNNSVLRLSLKNDAKTLDIKFIGKTAEATATNPLGDDIVIDSNTSPLVITIDGVKQTISFPAGTYTPETLALALNARIAGGYSRLGEGPDLNKLVIGTDLFGYGGTVSVEANPTYGIGVGGVEGNNDEGDDNTFPNIAKVTIDDIRAYLRNDEGIGDVIAEDVGGFIQFSTRAEGENETLAVVNATSSVHNILGFELLASGTPPAEGSNIRVYHKINDTDWVAEDDVTKFVPKADAGPFDDVGNFISLSIVVQDADGEVEIYDDVSLNLNDVNYIGKVLAQTPSKRSDELQHLLWCEIGPDCSSLKIYNALFKHDGKTGTVKNGFGIVHTLIGGTDGEEPVSGTPEMEGTYAAAFEQLRGLEDVSIVGAPGHASFETSNYQAIQGLLISHAEKPRAYRIAVLETPPEQTPGLARLERARIDSHRAALYYPWVIVANPLARPGNTEPKEIALPPTGFICGIYARNDSEKSVSKAPANEVVRSALRFERDVNFAENQLLNPLGINCLRFFPGRGYRVWGARTVTSDPEWKYVNVRRYFNYLESSIDRGTQWAVFENNGERLWSNIRETIESFLYNEWISGNLLGSNPKEAYFVRCDRSTMTQNDLDNGRLICLVGVSPLRPAEFVIFRIGQKTADAKS